MTRLTEPQRAALASGMSDASAGLVLGRSVGWVVRMRRDLAEVANAAQVASPEAVAVSAPEAVTTCAPSAAQVSVALAAAARVVGVDIEDVPGLGILARKARILAGAGMRARLGTPNTVLAALVGLHSPELSPSMVRRAGITTFGLLEISEALAGVESGGEPAVAMVVARRPVAQKAQAKPPRAPHVRKAAKAKPEAVPAPLCILAPAAGSFAMTPVRLNVGRLEDNLPVPSRAPEIPPRIRSRPLPRQPERPASRLVSRLKPVTPDIARWASWFAAAQWDLVEVADLFGVHPDALVDVGVGAWMAEAVTG